MVDQYCGVLMTSYNNGQWTAARFNSFIKSALRSASIRWPPKYSCLNKAYIGKKVNRKTGRLAKHFKCNSCNEEFPQSEIAVDHIDSVIDPIIGFVSWDEVIRRMFCEEDGLQVLCKQCHLIKTTAEKQQAKERKLNGK